MKHVARLIAIVAAGLTLALTGSGATNPVAWCATTPSANGSCTGPINPNM